MRLPIIEADGRHRHTVVDRPGRRCCWIEPARKQNYSELLVRHNRPSVANSRIANLCCVSARILFSVAIMLKCPR